MQKPAGMEEALFAALTSAFMDDELPELVALLGTHRLTTASRVRNQGHEGLVKLGLAPVLATELLVAVGAASPSGAPAPAVGAPDMVNRLVGELATALGKDPTAFERLSDETLLDRLIAGGGSDRKLVAFLAKRHELASVRGVVTKGGAVDRAMTLAYWRQSRNYLGQKWQGYPVVAVEAACGPREPHNPFALNEVLQGWQTADGLDLGAFKDAPGILNFFAWVAQNRAKLVADGGYALVEAILAKGVEGLAQHPRFARPLAEYQDECARNPVTASAFLARIFRAPGDTSGGTSGNTELQSAPEPSTTPNVAIYEALSKLLPAQFEEVVFRLRVPHTSFSPPSVAQSTRAIELCRWAENAQRQNDLQVAIATVSGNPLPPRLPEPGSTEWVQHAVRVLEKLPDTHSVATRDRLIPSGRGVWSRIENNRRLDFLTILCEMQNADSGRVSGLVARFLGHAATVFPDHPAAQELFALRDEAVRGAR